MKLENLILRTPLIPFHGNCTGGAAIYLKPENLQRLGSYKIRGIVSVVNNLSAHRLKDGLAVASAGNMAQAAAYVAGKMSIPCKVYVPHSVPDVKKNKIRSLGADMVEMPYDDVWGMVRGDFVLKDKSNFIHPALNYYLRKGYASIAHEIIRDMPTADAVVIPFGVGGLSLGVGMALKKLKPNISIITCEPETAAPLKASLGLRRATIIQRESSFVDAIGTPEVLPAVYKRLAPILSDSITVPIAQIKEAAKDLLVNHKLLCEGAAACGLAAAVNLGSTGRYQKIVCLLTGGNISPDFVLA